MRAQRAAIIGTTLVAVLFLVIFFIAFEDGTHATEESSPPRLNDPLCRICDGDIRSNKEATKVPGLRKAPQ